MAVKTPFSAEELKDILLHYEIGEYRSHTDFEKGADQTNILLVTSKGKYAFRYYEKRSSEYVSFEIDLLQCLMAGNYPCPAPIKNISGDYMGAYKAKPYALFTFLEGEHNDNDENYKEVAKSIGELHAITNGYKPVNSESRDGYNAASSWTYATKNAKKITPQTEAVARLAWLRSELDTLQLPITMPKGAIHGDTNPSNFLYKDGRISAVLDFDQAAYTYLIYDIANLLLWWAWPNKDELSFEKAKTIIAEYEKCRKLTQPEKRHLFDMLKMTILMSVSWFFHQDEDYLNDKRKIELLNDIGRDRFYDLLDAKVD